MKSLTRSILLIALMALFTSSLRADDWSRWRGNNANSISLEKNWNPEALGAQFKKVWEVQVGNGWSTVSVSKGHIYTMGNVDSKDIVLCLDEKTGTTLWQYAYDCPAGNFPGPRSTPVLDGTLVYTVGRNGDIYALDIKTGKVKWHVNVMSTFGAENITWGFSSSPVIDGNMLIINANTHGIALNKKTGSKIWASAPGKCGYASATIYTHNNKKFAAIFSQNAVYGVELSTGTPAWSYPWTTDYDINASDPVYYEGKIFISSGYNRGCTLLDISGSKPKAIYENKNMSAHFGSVVLKGKYLYGPDGNTGDGNAKLTCLNIETGNVEWSKVIGNNALIAAGDYLITISERGRVHIARWTYESYKEIATAVVLPTSRRNPTWTAPVLANGVLYCRNGLGQLVAIDLK
ncbi:PQQ-like beta-propeller repeat protein [bacterium]|nr:PQQ-like beta-propeller repeat protein [bacterium]